MKPVLRLFVVASLVAVVGCATARAPVRPEPRSLYERLGGLDAITAVVGEMLKRVAADAVINARFANSDLGHLQQMLVDQICAASGGPCKYTGKDMRTSHTGMKIGVDEFNAMVADLKGALDQFKVGPGEQKELLGVLGGMQPDIVGL